MSQIIDGRYEVIQALSEGAFGITYLAKDLRRPGQPRCVVKQLNLEREFTDDELQATLSFFDQEAEILERLGSHDQIPLLLAHLEEDGNFYIVQDFLEGRTLRDELRDVKRLPETEVITLLRQGLTVLSYVHQQGVIHRDIKPENLIRRRDGVMCLIDFGIVKEFSAQYLSRMAPTTDIAGTQGYAPDEQFRRGKPCPASDVYALGMVAIEALTGKFPTELDTDPATAELVWQTGLQINPALAKVLTKMVRHHHSRRYVDGKQALQALEKTLTKGVPTVVVSPKSPKVNEDELRSDRGIDYTRLRKLLKAQKWRKADRETYEVMIRAVGKNSGDWFTMDELWNFPGTDLHTIDRLWMKYSQGKFGFSVQKHILIECGANPDSWSLDKGVWEEFKNRIGWDRDSNWQSYYARNFNLSPSPYGRFPLQWAVAGWGGLKTSQFWFYCQDILFEKSVWVIVIGAPLAVSVVSYFTDPEVNPIWFALGLFTMIVSLIGPPLVIGGYYLVRGFEYMWAVHQGVMGLLYHKDL
ncbi:serine/threonine-protein kinase [Phormidium sp. FACHB-1136]|uniref:serine/threonine-protein kinase n=1 Tax=Phormidium sp. FACHB-1136 TaxID=2692848 RepID=UPI001688633A|nr:serine/threonine-protein kinase [Phormidium sp. FACHB-1136]MBD2425591.1 GUN4 domain-containing protein [Phormidium sp. FACHB-1136]